MLVATVALVALESFAVGAVEELLLRELHLASILDVVGCFEDACGGERPAGSALALVLHLGDSISFPPVD